MMEFILVKFLETREVIIDDNTSGQFVGDVIEVESGSHDITLSGEKNHLPTVQRINPDGTSPLTPEIVKFRLRAI